MTVTNSLFIDIFIAPTLTIRAIVLQNLEFDLKGFSFLIEFRLHYQYLNQIGDDFW